MCDLRSRPGPASRSPARQYAIEQHAERVDVRALVDLARALAALLRGHVVVRAQDAAGAGGTDVGRRRSLTYRQVRVGFRVAPDGLVHRQRLLHALMDL